MICRYPRCPLREAFKDEDVAATDDTRKEYTVSQLKLPVEERWNPPVGTRLAKDLYGSQAGDTAFIVGTGPSVSKAVKQLEDPVPGAFRICINRAIDVVPGEYWFFIDEESYRASKEKSNAANTKAIGVDRFWQYWGPEVYVWRRAYEPSHFREGRLIHRSCSLLGAMHFAVWLGATRIVTVGCDNRLEPGREYSDHLKSVYTCLFNRINKSLVTDVDFWLPSWVTMADASKGSLMLPKTFLGLEIKKLTESKGGIWQP